MSVDPGLDRRAGGDRAADTGALVIRAMSDDDEPAVLALLDAALAGGPTGVRSAEFFRWKHVANPFGRSPALVAVSDGAIVGLRTFLCWSFRAGSRTVRAVRAVDTATHPDYQGRGVFRALTTAAFAGLDDDVDLIFNTPNANSLPGYLKMGWSVVGSVPISIRPLHPVRLARHVRTAARRTPVAPRDLPPCPLPTADAVLQSLDDRPLTTLVGRSSPDTDERLATDRSPAFLRWRYGSAPGLDYRAVTAERAGELVGLAIGRPRRRGPLAEFTLSDVITAPGDDAAVRALLGQLNRCGSDHIATHLPPRTALARVGRRLGYLPVPRQGMVLVARPRRPVQPDPADLASWRFALGDLEVF